MPRTNRNLVDGFVYHVLNRGNNKMAIFKKQQDYVAFIKLIKEAKEKHPVKIFAYCLMPNHFHFVFQIIKSSEFIKMMHWLMNTHVKRYLAHYGGSGHVWQGRYKSFIVQNDAYLRNVLRYVESNPARGGMVNDLEDWKWSSYAERIYKAGQSLTDELTCELPQDWIKTLKQPLSQEELKLIRRSVNRESPYGDSKWQVFIARKYGLESTLKPRGRPMINPPVIFS